MNTTYVETWKAIGRVLGRSERWCRYMTRVGDPLPVFKVGGIIRLNASDLSAWLARQRDRTIARDADERFVRAADDRFARPAPLAIVAR